MRWSALLLFIALAAASSADSDKNTKGHCFAQRSVTSLTPIMAVEEDDPQPAAEIQQLDARGRSKGFGNPTGVVVQGRDGCPCMTDIPQSLSPKWNISAEIPEGLEMKHSGWTEDYTDRGIGIFATRAFKKGDVVGGAHARVVPCKGTEVQTPMGTRSLTCEIHFFDLPKCSSGSIFADDGTLAIFPSWISFLNAPDEYDEAGDKEAQNSGVGANLDFGSSTCKSNPDEESEWTLVASQDISPGNELIVLYDERGMKMMRKMKAAAKTGKKMPAMKAMKKMRKSSKMPAMKAMKAMKKGPAMKVKK